MRPELGGEVVVRVVRVMIVGRGSKADRDLLA
jgi:hypothetical protein